MITVEKTTYLVDGCEEPCFEISDGYTMVRIAKFYHFIGKNTLAVSEYLDGEWNSSEEQNSDFDRLTEFVTRRIAKEYSVYLH